MLDRALCRHLAVDMDRDGDAADEEQPKYRRRPPRWYQKLDRVGDRVVVHRTDLSLDSFLNLGTHALQSPPRLDDASDGPGLGGRTAREVRRLGFEDFADGSEPGIEQVIPHGAETLQRQIGIAAHAVFRQRVMAE